MKSIGTACVLALLMSVTTTAHSYSKPNVVFASILGCSQPNVMLLGKGKMVPNGYVRSILSSLAGYFGYEGGCNYDS